MKGIRLEQISFDNMENHNPITVDVLGTFVDDNANTASYKVDLFLKEMPAQKMYTGWDDQVYPQYRLVKINIS